MSFYTSLTGLNAATAMLGVTSNNISNVGTTGFKRSRADFGDIFATSPLQKASATVGQGVALKQVSQEFSQGNISFSANSLDLAITGDGFFPMRSADGLQEVFTRNGSFMLNEQFNVVNSAGQRLMAATVDSTGSANVNERVILSIPQKTSGEAKETSLVSLGLNFPADADVIKVPFNRANPATYNKSTAFTVYDNGGNGYLATIYYVKTSNASEDVPANKWQSYVFIGEDQVAPALISATNDSDQRLYVNQYGQIKPYDDIKDELTTGKTQLFSLDELIDKRTSVPAKITGSTLVGSPYDWASGVDFTALSAAQITDLSSLFDVDVDKSGAPVTVDLSGLATQTKVTGSMLASEVTNFLNKQFGDQSNFDLSAANNKSFIISSSKVATGGVPTEITITLTDAAATGSGSLSSISIDETVAAIQTQIDASALKSGTTTVTVSYDYATQGLKFVDGNGGRISMKSATGNNDVFGLTAASTTLSEAGYYSAKVIPNGAALRPAEDQRFGMSMTFDSVNKTFNLQSNTTGDQSSIKISNINATAQSILGLPLLDTFVDTSALAVRGIESTPAVAKGTMSSVDVSNSFTVDDSNNKFVVTVNGVMGTVVLPKGSDYTLDTFMTRLEKGINSLGNNNPDGTPISVNGVNVTYDANGKNFVFTTGTTGADAFVKISGSANWGLEKVDAGRGKTSTWINPTQHRDVVGGISQPKYIDSNGNETTNGDGFTTLPSWSPVFLDKGELTFATSGKLTSPKGTQLETFYLPGGKGALTINIDYQASTQYSAPFAVLSQSQDGAPEGDLVGMTIGNDGLVSASFSNGTQKSLAKILLANFSSPVGLRQIGDSSYLTSASSGKPMLGTAGSAGFGTLRAGATERANVDLTQELVDLITAQRNFQANAKAIETSSTMTSAIINLRS
jgi:flagellar hook-basal body protein